MAARPQWAGEIWRGQIWMVWMVPRTSVVAMRLPSGDQANLQTCPSSIWASCSPVAAR